MSTKDRGAVAWVIVFQVIGYCLGRMTQPDISSWYSTLHKSSLTPPNIVFPIVWIMLYVPIALAGYSLWQYRYQLSAKIALLFYTLQILLNWAWTPLFFYFHKIGASLLCILAIIIFTMVTLIITRNRYKLSYIMLIPYFVWLLFAGYLNAYIWMFN